MKYHRYLATIAIAGAYLHFTHGYSFGPPPPPPPPAPIGNELLHLGTVGAIIAYGVWKARR